MTQEEFNESTLKVLTQLTETLSDMGKTRDAMYQLIQLESSRVDSAEDRIDILMGERGERISNESVKKSYATDTENLTEGQLDKSQDLTRNSIISDAIDRIAKETITPKALLDLGFIEEYQPPIDGCAGFIYYDFSMHGVDLLSTAVSNEEPLYVFFENQHEIHNLRKLGDLITALNEL